MNDFRSYDPPRFHIATGTESDLCNMVWKLQRDVYPGFVIKVLRGQRMRESDRLFQEFGAALQFPYYFGSNWDALDECLRDLTWIPGAGYILFISNAQDVLADDREKRTTLVETISEAAEFWTSQDSPRIPGSHPEGPVPFHCVFNCTADKISVAQGMLEGVAYSTFSLDRT